MDPAGHHKDSHPSMGTRRGGTLVRFSIAGHGSLAWRSLEPGIEGGPAVHPPGGSVRGPSHAAVRGAWPTGCLFKDDQGIDTAVDGDCVCPQGAQEEE